MACPPVDRRRAALVLALIAAAALPGLQACATLGGPRVITLELNDLVRGLERRFPLERRLLEVLDVTVARPDLRLLPERNRLALALDVAARDRLFGGAWRGRLALDSALRWEAADQSVRLLQVRVAEFTLDAAASAGGNRASQAERLAAVLTERVLEDLSLWRASPEQLQSLQRVGLAPSAVTVTARGVEVTLAPLPR